MWNKKNYQLTPDTPWVWNKKSYQLTPWVWNKKNYQLTPWVWKKEEKLSGVSLDIQRAFTNVYNQKGWGDSGGGSGTGSDLDATAKTRVGLKELIKKFNIKSIMDGACGAMVWMSVFLEDLEKEIPDITYHGCDVVSHVIEQNKKRFSEKHPNWHFSVCDITRTHFPSSDLIITRQVLQHLSIKFILEYFKNLKANNIKYVLLENNPLIKENAKTSGLAELYPYNFFLPPFNLTGDILHTIQEKSDIYVTHGGVFQMNLYEVAKISFSGDEKRIGK